MASSTHSKLSVSWMKIKEKHGRHWPADFPTDRLQYILQSSSEITLSILVPAVCVPYARNKKFKPSSNLNISHTGLNFYLVVDPKDPLTGHARRAARDLGAAVLKHLLFCSVHGSWPDYQAIVLQIMKYRQFVNIL